MRLCNLPRLSLDVSALYVYSNPNARWLRLVGYKIAACLYVLGKGIHYILSCGNTFSLYTPSYSTVSTGGPMSWGLVTGLTLGSYSHDAKWTVFQGRPILAVLPTAFFTFRITDLAKLLVNLPGFNALHDLITTHS